MEQTEQTGVSTRRDRRRERTRRTLLDTGRALIAEKGVAGLRIQEITERADIALGSFYNYFSSKEELVEAVVGESLADLASATVRESDANIDPAITVSRAVVRFMRLTEADPDFARLVVNLSHADVLFTTAIYPYARIALERGIDSGRFVIADIEVTLTAVMGAALALIREILEGHKTPDVDRAFSSHVLCALGLTPAEAAEVWDRAS